MPSHAVEELQGGSFGKAWRGFRGLGLGGSLQLNVACLVGIDGTQDLGPKLWEVQSGLDGLGERFGSKDPGFGA